jgi:hypothetical protein
MHKYLEISLRKLAVSMEESYSLMQLLSHKLIYTIKYTSAKINQRACDDCTSTHNIIIIIRVNRKPQNYSCFIMDCEYHAMPYLGETVLRAIS